MTKHNLAYEVLLIGDSGNVKRKQPDEILTLLNNHLPNSTESLVLFLGDNVYPHGLPAKEDVLREDAEMVLKAHFNAVKDFNGKVAFISGNHDWNKGKSDGLAYVLRQEDYLNNLFGPQKVFFPENGCPGPAVVFSNDFVIIITINTQWWVQKGKKQIGKSCGCDQENEEDFFTQLESLLIKHKNKRILVAGHYPIYSNSLHGGKYKIKHHLFPFTLYKKNAYLPLPFIGSLLPMYRKYFGAKEDLSNPKFRILRKRLKAMFRNYPGLTYVAGHEHNLQFIEKYHNNFIVSGAASKSTYVMNSKYSRFAMSAKGFFKLKFYDDLKVKVEVLIVDENNKDGELVYDGWMN
nr:metallophosphoesterase [uncultured Pedobacter sp.]